MKPTGYGHTANHSPPARTRGAALPDRPRGSHVCRWWPCINSVFAVCHRRENEGRDEPNIARLEYSPTVMPLLEILQLFPRLRILRSCISTASLAICSMLRAARGGSRMLPGCFQTSLNAPRAGRHQRLLYRKYLSYRLCT